MPEESPELLKLYQRLSHAYELLDADKSSSGLSGGELLALIEGARMWVGAAHDLKNQFGIMNGYLTFILQHSGMNETQKKNIQVVTETLSKGQQILERTIQVMRGGECCREYTDLQGIVEKAALEVTKYRDLAPAHFQIDQKFDPMLPKVNVDPLQMERVFFNLIRNAAQAMKESGVGNVLRIASWYLEPHAYVSFCDNGPGLPDSVLTHAGRPLLTTRRGKGGSGLGLMIVQQFVKAHGGRVKIRNIPEGGAEFLIILPV